jgi:Xaa-Pro aminopeptidase
MPEAHFQSFEDRTDRAASGPRLLALRAELKRRGLGGFVIPHADRFQNEYLPACDERLEWVTGFTGSAGFAIVLADRAALFVDGRYTLQARDQVDGAQFSVEHLVDSPWETWLEANLAAGATLGYDPWLHTLDGAERLAKACVTAGARLTATTPNPIDAIWSDRPAPPRGAIVLHDLRFAGEPVTDKLARIGAEIDKLKADALVVSDPQSVCWSFNIRGSDIEHTPLALACAIVPKVGRPAIYLDRHKLADDAARTLGDIADVRPAEQFESDLAALGDQKRSVRLDQATAADAIERIITAHGGQPTRGIDPIALMKAVKNPTEIAGARAAHVRDGAAMARFLAWFDREAPKGTLTEIDAVEALENFRRDTGVLKDISFPSISGAGPHGAIVHYRVTRQSNRRISADELFLIDSGAQYEDGTTDITRTIIVGAPRPDMLDRFTRVLRGHIAIARAVFPDGSSGAQLDPFARQYLWSAGLDFDHGTGHGVGSYLSVHEGPGRIAKLGAAALKRGMILSNEPGYYKTGDYGIRIENLLLVTEADPVPDAERPLNGFETLTLAPIDLRLISPTMLTISENAWLNAYHARVRDTLAPLVDGETRAWLERATRPIGKA